MTCCTPVAAEPGRREHAATCPVDAFPASAFGMHSMIGNVREWTASPWGTDQVLNGGSYLCHASYCRRYRPAARSRAALDSSMGNTGFRCAGDVT